MWNLFIIIVIKFSWNCTIVVLQLVLRVNQSYFFKACFLPIQWEARGQRLFSRLEKSICTVLDLGQFSRLLRLMRHSQLGHVSWSAFFTDDIPRRPSNSAVSAITSPTWRDKITNIFTDIYFSRVFLIIWIRERKSNKKFCVSFFQY